MSFALAVLLFVHPGANRLTWAAATSPFTGVCFCHPSSPPYLFGPRSLVERAWTPAATNFCRGANRSQAVVCTYRSGFMRVAVTYGSANQAVEFELLYAGPSEPHRTWNFLIALLPRQARIARCTRARNFNHSGLAHVCTYTYRFSYREGRTLHEGRSIVVAQYLHPRTGAEYGAVTPQG